MQRRQITSSRSVEQPNTRRHQQSLTDNNNNRNGGGFPSLSQGSNHHQDQQRSNANGRKSSNYQEQKNYNRSSGHPTYNQTENCIGDWQSLEKQQQQKQSNRTVVKTTTSTNRHGGGVLPPLDDIYNDMSQQPPKQREQRSSRADIKDFSARPYESRSNINNPEDPQPINQSTAAQQRRPSQQDQSKQQFYEETKDTDADSFKENSSQDQQKQQKQEQQQALDNLPEQIQFELTKQLKQQLANYHPSFAEVENSSDLKNLIEDTKIQLQEQSDKNQMVFDQLQNDQDEIIDQIAQLGSTMLQQQNQYRPQRKQTNNCQSEEDWTEGCKNLFVKIEVQRRYFNSVACELLSFVFNMNCPSSLEAHLERSEIITTDLLSKTGRSFPLAEFIEQRDQFYQMNKTDRAKLLRERETFLVRPGNYQTYEERNNSMMMQQQNEFQADFDNNKRKKTTLFDLVGQ